MIRSRSKRSWQRFIWFLLLVGLLCTMSVVLLKTQSTRLSGPFELEASQQWIVRQDDATEFVARHTLGRRQAVQNVQVFSFPRNDIVEINLVSNVTEGMRLEQGARVLELHSLSDAARSRMLAARVERLQQQLQLAEHGELQARVAEARAGLALAQTNLIAYQPILLRRRELAKQGVIPAVDLELSEAENSRLRQEVRMAESTVRVREMQSAPGVSAMARAELEEAEQELAMVNARLQARWLHTPVEGRLTRESGDPAILVRVMRETRLDARVTLPAEFIHMIREEEPVTLTFGTYSGRQVTSTVEQVFVHTVPELGRSVMHVLVPVENAEEVLRASMRGRAAFPQVRIDPLALLWQRVRGYLGMATEQAEREADDG